MADRHYTYACITYHTEDTIKRLLSFYSYRIRHYAYIMHDKDTKDDGTIKDKHFHILLYFNNAISQSACRKLFPSIVDDRGLPINTLAQPVKELSSAFAYLDHSDTSDKYQYDPNSVHSDNIDYWRGLTPFDDDNKYINIISDMQAKVPLLEMVKRYGRDFVLYYQKFADFKALVDEEERRAERRACIYSGAVYDDKPTPFDKPVQLVIDDNKN